MGVAPGWGGAGRLVEIVGRGRALELLLSCRRLGAGEAASCGLVDHVLDTEGEEVQAATAWLRGDMRPIVKWKQKCGIIIRILKIEILYKIWQLIIPYLSVLLKTKIVEL